MSLQRLHLTRTWPDAVDSAGLIGVQPPRPAVRLLKAILATGVEDDLLKRDPCRIKGVGQEKSAERPVLTLVQVVALAEAVAPRYRALVRQRARLAESPSGLITGEWDTP